MFLSSTRGKCVFLGFSSPRCLDDRKLILHSASVSFTASTPPTTLPASTIENIKDWSDVRNELNGNNSIINGLNGHLNSIHVLDKSMLIMPRAFKIDSPTASKQRKKLWHWRWCYYRLFHQHWNPFPILDGKHSSNLNDIYRSEQKSSFETKSSWPTDDSFSSAGELSFVENLATLRHCQAESSAQEASYDGGALQSMIAPIFCRARSILDW